jgi:ketosteroid isomerase-like protein
MSKDEATIIRNCFEAYRRKERSLIEPLLADDLRFTSPYDDAIDRATYFERCWPNSDRILKHEIETLIVEGDEAFVTYKAFAINGNEFRNTEFFRFRDSQIVSINVYFGASYKDGTFVKQS